MKVQILDTNGSKKSELNTTIFDAQIRLDLLQKISEIEKLEERQLYAPFWRAGLQTSASGNVKHNRHVWKSDRGKGMGRFPKKRMSDKGDRFVWVAASIPGVRGGRRAHPPKLLRADFKINKKEREFALKSALAAVASLELVKKKYASLANKDLKIKLPLVVDSKITELKAKEFFNSIKKIIGEDLIKIAIQEREVRAGIGKMRGRKYKKNSGMLLVIGNKEQIKISGIDSAKVKDLKIKDMALNGSRLTMFTEAAVKDAENKFNGKNLDK